MNAQNNNIYADSTFRKSQEDSLKLILGENLDSATISIITQINLSELAPDPNQFKFEEIDSSDLKYIPFFTKTKDYEKALQKAKKSGKPILVYFSGYGCVSPKKMEDKVLSEPSIQKFCSKKMEVITLYIDDPTRLDEQIDVIDPFTKKKKTLRNIGHKHDFIQLKKFKGNTQPSFYIIDEHEQILISYGYSPIINDFKNFLKTGKDLFYK